MPEQRLRARRQILGGSAAWLSLAGSAALRAQESRPGGRAPLRVTYPAPESALDRRSLDLVALLASALSRTVATHGPFELRPAALPRTEARQVLEVEGGERLNVLWSSPTPLKDRRLLAVPFDTRRGLLGLRLLLIDAARQGEFSALRSVQDLRRFSMGQGESWADTRVYLAEGIRVVTAANYEALFRMLMAGRFDAFPRGVGEVFPEWEARRESLPSLAVESGLLLHYAWPFYFYVSPREPVLAQRLLIGLHAMRLDGSFERHLWQHHGEAVRRARLNERLVVHLRDPAAPAGDTNADLDAWRLTPPR